MIGDSSYIPSLALRALVRDAIVVARYPSRPQACSYGAGLPRSQVKPEWASLQAQFTPLTLSTRLLCVINELKALKQEIDAKPNGALSDMPGSLHFMLRKIQRYVEWTVPELLPDRAEEAEILVNVSRFAARLLI